MKLIDADKLQDWIDRTEFAFYGRYGETGEGVVKALGMLKEQMEAGYLSPTPPVQPDTQTSGTEIMIAHQAQEFSDLIHKIFQLGINPGDRVRHTGQDKNKYGKGTVIDVGLTSSRVKWDNSNVISRPLTKLLEVITDEQR